MHAREIQRLDRNESGEKTTTGLISKTTTLHVHHTFLYISLPFLHDSDVKMSNFAFCGERKQATTTEILFLFLNLDMVLWNSTSGGFAFIWQSKWVGIIAIKTERTQIHFLSDVLVAVASLDLKVPILVGKLSNRRHSTASFSENVVMAETSYQMLEVLSICDRERA